MARSRIFDLLQAYPFWLLDIDPSPRIPFVVLGGPAFGFSSISMPEISVETEEINQLNSMWKRHVVTGASVGNLTLQRGVRFYDSSFYTWTMRTIYGEDVSSRNLLLIHHMGLTIGESPVGVANFPTSDLVEILRIPGKAWLLHECIPVRYKAGSDLDATSSEVSIQELDIAVSSIEEFSLDPTLNLDFLP